MTTVPNYLLELRALRAELESDLLFCTTRDSHIRLATRIAALNRIILNVTPVRDTTDASDTVVP